MRPALCVLLAACALGATACRAIVGIEDLSVVADGGADATSDAAGDATAETAPSDAAGESTTPVDAGADSCADMPQYDASPARIACIQNCKAGAGPPTVAAFYGGPTANCFCNACAAACRMFCGSCGHLAGLPSCDDCATHVIVDDGGACRNTEMCMTAACMSLATCLEGCGP